MVYQENTAVSLLLNTCVLWMQIVGQKVTPTAKGHDDDEDDDYSNDGDDDDDNLMLMMMIIITSLLSSSSIC